MPKYIREILIAALVLVGCLPAQARTDNSIEQTKIDFRGKTSLVFSHPLKNMEEKKFGHGWKRAIFIDGSGNQIPLFPMEFFTSMDGLIFSGNYLPRISPSGKYAVLDVLRTGVVDPRPSEMVEDSSRQYCPVLNTISGCIVSMQTGELCGGDWSETADAWIVTGYQYDATKAMVDYGFSMANSLWSQFLKSTKFNVTTKIKKHLADNLGIENMMTCEPPTKNNKNSYALIARQLRKEGDSTDATYIEGKLAAIADDSDISPDQGIGTGRAYRHGDSY